jgi:transposase
MDQIVGTFHKIINNTPLVGVREIKIRLYDELNITLSKSTIWRAIKTLGYSSKKVHKVINTSKNGLEIKRAYIKSMQEKALEEIVCLDETCFQLETHRSYGWSKRGTRCIHNSSKRSWTNITGQFLISSKGIVAWKLYKKSINGESFVSFLDHLDKNYMDGKTLVMDNLSVHHMTKVKELLKSMKTEAKYIPPYSPELNPIEEMFSWLKRSVRKKIITIEEDLKMELTHLIEEINQTGLHMYYNHAYDM